MKSWSEWVVENLNRNCDPEGIAQILLENQFSVQAIRGLMGSRCPDRLGDAPVPRAGAPALGSQEALYRKRESVVHMQRKLAGLNPKAVTIARRSGVSREEFLERYYSANYPVVLCDLMKDWAAPTRWTAQFLRETCGDQMVEIMAARESNPSYEIDDKPHRKHVRFAEFVDMVMQGKETNDYYLTARNDFFNLAAMKPLLQDFAPFPDYLKPDVSAGGVFFWFGPKGTITPLHHDPMNIFMAQVEGRKHVKLVPASELDLVYNHFAVYSQVDCENPDYETFPVFAEATVMDVELQAGEVLFLPAGWWHHVKALDRSMTITFNNFVFPNEFQWVHPPGSR